MPINYDDLYGTYSAWNILSTSSDSDALRYNNIFLPTISFKPVPVIDVIEPNFDSNKETITGIVAIKHSLSREVTVDVDIDALKNAILAQIHCTLLSSIRDTREYVVKIFKKTKYHSTYNENYISIDVAILLLNYDDAEIGDSVRIVDKGSSTSSTMIDSKGRVWEFHSKDDVYFYTRIK